MSNTTHAGSSSLRHSAKRRRNRASAMRLERASRKTVVIATRNGVQCDPRGKKELRLFEWIRSDGRDARLIGYVVDRDSSCSNLIEVRGPIILPATVGEWVVREASQAQVAQMIGKRVDLRPKAEPEQEDQPGRIEPAKKPSRPLLSKQLIIAIGLAIIWGFAGLNAILAKVAP